MARRPFASASALCHRACSTSANPGLTCRISVIWRGRFAAGAVGFRRPVHGFLGDSEKSCSFLIIGAFFAAFRVQLLKRAQPWTLQAPPQT